MKYVVFTAEEKAAMFDEIAAQFYESNFGHLSKADMELMMFHFYLEKMIRDNKNPDGTIDYRKCSDYKISQDLGITQQRVRNMKIKKQLYKPIEFDWKASLASLTENARYDRSTKMVVLNIPDPVLYLEIQNFIEEQGAYIEKQLNSKVLKIRAEYYIELIVAMEPEESRKAVIRELKKQFKESGGDEKVFDEKNLGRSFINGAMNVISVAASVSSMLEPENPFRKVLGNLFAG